MLYYQVVGVLIYIISIGLSGQLILISMYYYGYTIDRRRILYITVLVLLPVINILGSSYIYYKCRHMGED